jgi:hypothetical protein
MTQNLRTFTALAQSNEEFAARVESLNASPTATPEDFVDLATEFGIPLTLADFDMPVVAAEVSDDELAAIAAGAGGCACFVGGGGTDYTGPNAGAGCVCAIAGIMVSTGGGCGCVMAGGGVFV